MKAVFYRQPHANTAFCVKLLFALSLTQGLLVAPLRTEFWDDRLPENREDLWRVLDSAARCLGLQLLSDKDAALRKQNRKTFAEKWESWNYEDFLEHWRTIFRGHEEKLQDILGVTFRRRKKKSNSIMVIIIRFTTAICAKATGTLQHIFSLHLSRNPFHACSTL